MTRFTWTRDIPGYWECDTELHGTQVYVGFVNAVPFVTMCGTGRRTYWEAWIVSMTDRQLPGPYTSCQQAKRALEKEWRGEK
jgi:hypothetical protein